SKTAPQIVERPLARAGPVASRAIEDDGQPTAQVPGTKFGRREILAAIDVEQTALPTAADVRDDALPDRSLAALQARTRWKPVLQEEKRAEHCPLPERNVPRARVFTHALPISRNRLGVQWINVPTPSPSRPQRTA